MRKLDPRVRGDLQRQFPDDVINLAAKLQADDQAVDAMRFMWNAADADAVYWPNFCRFVRRVKEIIEAPNVG